VNLKQIKDMIFSITDYNPDVETYQNEVTRIINEVYEDFFSSRPWTFSQKEIDMYTMPDVTVADAVITSTTPANPQSHLVTNVGAIAADPRYEGSILQVTNATDTTDQGEYFIDSCDTLTQIFVSKKAIYGSPAWTTTTNPVTVVAKQRYITLPDDCVVPLGVSVRDPTVTTGPGPYGPIFELNRRDDAEMGLWLDSTGTPNSWVPYDNVPGGELDVTDFPPLPGDLSVSTVACVAGEAWPAGSYEFFLAYRFRGHIGPIGEAVKLTIGNALVKPRFATRDTTLSGMAGLHKHIFYRIVEITATGYTDDLIRDMNAYSMTTTPVPVSPGTGAIIGQQFYIPDENISIDTPPDWLGGVSSNEQKLRSVPRAPDFTEGTYWRIRLHPRPNFYMPIRIRYIRKCHSLVADTDTPEMPPDTHRYVVYRSCEELFAKHNALPQAALYKTKADAEEKRLAAQWLTQRAASYVKGPFRSSPGYYKPFRRLIQLP
jgi:hypothetical protein